MPETPSTSHNSHYVEPEAAELLAARKSGEFVEQALLPALEKHALLVGLLRCFSADLESVHDMAFSAIHGDPDEWTDETWEKVRSLWGQWLRIEEELGL